MSRPLSVAIWGWYGHQNTGDDALAATISWGVDRFMRPGRIDMISPKRLVLSPGIHARYLTSVRKVRGFQLRLRVLMANVYIIGGGSGLHDNGGPALLRQRLRLMRAGGLLGQRTIGAGMSLGPIHTPEGEKLLCRVLERTAWMWVRDQRSLDLARSLGELASRNVGLAVDPAVLIDRIGLPEPACLSRPDRPVILVSPCDYHRVYTSSGSLGDEVRRERLAECLKEICRKSDAFIRLLVMNGSAHIGDRLTCDAVASRLPGERVEVVEYDPNPLFAFRAIQASDLVVGMRLHSLIYAYAASVPFIALNYHVKVQDFVEVVGADEVRIVDAHAFDPAALAEMILQALQAPRPARLPSLPVAEAHEQVLAAFQCIADVVGAEKP